MCWKTLRRTTGCRGNPSYVWALATFALSTMTAVLHALTSIGMINLSLIVTGELSVLVKFGI